LGSSGAGAGVTVAAGGGVADGFGAAAGVGGALFAAAGFGFGLSLFALAFATGLFAKAGLSAAGGVSEICACALAVIIRQPVRIDIGRRRFIAGAIPARL
jgi:hypothetical protein